MGFDGRREATSQASGCFETGPHGLEGGQQRGGKVRRLLDAPGKATSFYLARLVDLEPRRCSRQDEIGPTRREKPWEPPIAPFAVGVGPCEERTVYETQGLTGLEVGLVA